MQWLFNVYRTGSVRLYRKLARAIPGFDKVMEKVRADCIERVTKLREIKEARKQAEKEMQMFGQVLSYSGQMVTKKSGEETVEDKCQR